MTSLRQYSLRSLPFRCKTFYYLCIWVSAVNAALTPVEKCPNEGYHFDIVTQRCRRCSEQFAVPTDDGHGCTCLPGFIICRAGETCYLDESTQIQVTESSFECRECPLLPSEARNGRLVPGGRAAPTEDRTRCMPCGDTTLGFSEVSQDCECPPFHAISERDERGALRQKKECVSCSADAFPGPQMPSRVYSCELCPDPVRMYYNPDTWQCDCRQGGIIGGAPSDGFVKAGELCVDKEEYDAVNNKFPEANAAAVRFRDSIDDQEEWWTRDPMGTYVGLQVDDDDKRSVLNLDTSNEVLVTSATMKWLYVRCAVGCLRKNATACNCISNLCVLQLYEDRAVVCEFITDFLYKGSSVSGGLETKSDEEQGRRPGLPWLFYEPQRPQETLSNDVLGWTFTLGDKGQDAQGTEINMLVFWLAKYGLEGEWLGWEKVEQQLELCASLGGLSDATSTWRRFGSTLVRSCTLPLSKLLKCGLNPVFYDLYVQNVDGSLVPVPVRILNLVRSGRRPNQNIEVEDTKDDVLVRRFLLCEAVSGKEGSPDAYVDGEQLPRIFRWASQMTMQIRTNSKSEEAKILVPVLSIMYSEKQTQNLRDGMADRTVVTFKSEYSMDTSSYWTSMIVLLIVTLCITTGLAGFWLYHLEQRCPVDTSTLIDPGVFMPKPALQALTFLSTFFAFLFWFHVVMAAYWVIFFKMQSAPHLLLPSALEGDEYEPHDLMLVILTCTDLFIVGLYCFKNLKVFIFLLDWEGSGEGKRRTEPQNPADPYGQSQYGQGAMGQYGQGQYGQRPQTYGQQSSGLLQSISQPPQGQYGNTGQYGQPAGAVSGTPLGSSAIAQGYAQSSTNKNVSAWRSLLICNELNERMSLTRTSAYITWLSMAAILEGLGWKHMARWHPSTYGTSGEVPVGAPYNPFLQFGLAAGIWFVLIVVQLILRWVMSIAIGLGTTDFVDVCSLANISVFIMDEPCHGYYIHGKSPSGRGDISTCDLMLQLSLESQEGLKKRGLTHDTGQTFETFWPTHFRQTVFNVFKEVQAIHTRVKGRPQKKPTSQDMFELSARRDELMSLLTRTLDEVETQHQDVVQVQRQLEKFWGISPDIANLQKPIFYEDFSQQAWTSCLAMGKEFLGFPIGFEWNLITMELLLFSIVWRFTGAVYLAVAVAFLFNQLVLWTYAAAGKTVLSFSTIIDKIFLI